MAFQVKNTKQALNALTYYTLRDTARELERRKVALTTNILKDETYRAVFEWNISGAEDDFRDALAHHAPKFVR